MTAEPKRKDKIRTAFQEFIEERLGTTLERLSNKKLISKALTQFYVEELHNPLRAMISEDDFGSAFVDASDDLGVDLIHKDDGMVYIVQTKYAKVGSDTDSATIEHFRNVLLRLKDEKLRRNSKLHDALIDIDFETDQFNCRFLTLGRIAGQARQLSEESPVVPPGIHDLADRVTFEFLDEEGLNIELRTARTTREIPNTDCTFFSHGDRGKRSTIIQLNESDHPCWVMVVDAPQLVQAYSQHKEALFNLNIRNYISDTPINKSIRETAEDRAEQFFHLNNGISCVASKVDFDREANSVTAHGFQVINGAQTLRSLHKASLKKWKSGKPFVLVRITEIPDGYGESKRFRDDIIRANNTQNVIKVSDFRSNDPVQRGLVKQFQSYHRFGRQVIYVPKRTDNIPRLSEVVRLEEFSKSIYSFMRDPVKFSGSTAFLFDASENGGYRYVFGNGKEVWDQMPTDEFRLRSAIWWLAVAFGERLAQSRNETVDNTARAAMERKWLFIHAARLAMELEFGDSYRSSLARHYKGEWTLGKASTGEFFEEIYQRAHASVLFAYKQAAKQEKFVHRNWMRSEMTSVEIKEAAETLKSVGRAFPKFPSP